MSAAAADSGLPMPGIAISAIAWPAEADGEALALAAQLGFTGIEIAPVKAFGVLADADEASVRAYGEGLAAAGLEVPALQGLLFGVPDLGLFADPASRERLADALGDVARVAGWLGADVCVFGSPGLRDPGALDAAAASDLARDFFRGVADAFVAAGARIGFEANAEVYGCRFGTTTAEAAAFVEAVDHPGFRLHLDAGTVFINGESTATFAELAGQGVHFHASEPELVPLGSAGVDHASVAAALRRGGYAGWRSVEMRATDDWRAAMTAAATLMREHYA